jgi:hypothetical protein
MIHVGLALELESCQRILALRKRYHRDGLFVLAFPYRMAYKRSNLDMLRKRLPILAAAHSSFDMEFYNLHRSSGRAKMAVKYSLRSDALIIFATILKCNSPMRLLSRTIPIHIQRELESTF